MSYLQLDREILNSTVWVGTDSDTKTLWFFLLLAADIATGIVTHTLPAIVRDTGINREKVDAILKKFLSPDPDSRSKEHDGRRIEFIDTNNPNGGIRVLNYEKYKEKHRSQSAVRMRRKRERDRYVTGRHKSSDVTPSDTCYVTVTKEKEKEKELTTLSSGDDGSGSGPRIQDGVKVSKSVKRKLKTDEITLWEFWKRVHRKSDAHVVDNKRLAAMRRALDNHTLDEMKRVVIGCRNSPHHQGDNDRAQKYNDIELICRDETHFSNFVRLYRPGDELEYGEDFTGEVSSA